LCPICQNLTDKEICNVCADENRDHALVCVVTDAKTVIAMEKVREFKGVYHVLHGLISPMNGITPDHLIAALDTDFENDAELLHLLRYEAPKMGTGAAEAQTYTGMLLSAFADALHGKTNCLGGVWRAGTGTAMYYLWHARELGATADGRRAGEPLGTNFSPSLFARIPGPVTDIEAFTANDLSDTINGGPLTLEFSASIFKNEDSIRKIASLIQYFILRGGHQLQLNAVDIEAMRQAQKNPDAYRQLVVRIWGWSAYFVELDKEYQDHVMARQEYTV
jgi:formate C-acetyltransferase